MSRIKTTVATTARRMLPPGSWARDVLATTYRGAQHTRATFVSARQRSLRARSDREVGLSSYAQWRKQQSRQVSAANADDSTTSFLIVVEGAEGAQETLRTIASVRGQLQEGSRAVVLPPESDLSAFLDGSDEDFVLFLRAGDLLEARALADIAKSHRADPVLEFVGFDRDHEASGKRVDPLFLPAWSPEMLLGANYFDRAFAIKLARVKKISSPLTLTDRGIWKMLLLSGLSDRTAGRLPEVLLTSPQRPRTALGEADAEIVAAALAELGETAETSVENGVVRVRLLPAEWPTVSIVIPTRHSRNNLQRVLPSLARTDYPSFDVQIIDNGGYSEENAAWYAENSDGLTLDVIWWSEQPFNYSRVNNVAIRATSGEVVVMLNDDTEAVDPGWLKEMVGFLGRPGVGSVGVQHRQGDGLIQHGGVVVGPGGSADNLFAGLQPGSDTLIGPTDWYRNSLAVTGACVATWRTVFEEVGGLDERFILCGSDVVFGLDQVIRGRRNVVVPFDTVRHFESITRGMDSAPVEDYYASYWRYHPWLLNGDPYLSPNLSPLSSVPVLRNENDPSPVELALRGMGRPFNKVAQNMGISAEAYALLSTASVSRDEVRAVHELHQEFSGPLEIRTINWFIPDIDMPFFGGLNTAFRLADKLKREHGVRNRFVVLGARNELFIRSALAAAFASLGDSDIVFYEGRDEEIAQLPPADIAVATLWLTAMHVAKAGGVKRKFYLMQDFEPAFYPASTMYAMAEESYRLGLYGLCNTDSMGRIYSGLYHGKSMSFTPAVDRSVYHPAGRRVKDEDEPVTIFAYARDHFRNCWELVFSALSEIKRIHGDRVRIVAAGARYLPPSADFIDMGLLDYRATGSVYRETDIGITMQVSRHPSYLPLELMASGVPMVAPDSDWFYWLFQDGENSLLTMRTLGDAVSRLDTLVRDAQLREELRAGALRTIDEHHSDWDAALDGVWAYMTDPERGEAGGER